MKIGLVASEGVPFSKTGGLADVTGALFRVLAERGNETYLILPYYDQTKKVLSDFDKEYKVEVEISERKINGKILIKQYHKNAYAVMVENQEYFDRKGLYGQDGVDYSDNAERFGFFDKAVVEIVEKGILNFDILHLNDWQTGLIPLFIRDHRLSVKTLFTIHNLAYQGNFTADILPLLKINPEFFNIEGIEFYGKASFLKSGIVFSDKISTVSPSYAKEILTPEFGEKLEGILKTRKNDLYGVLNGIDYELWNPEIDKYIYANYSYESLDNKTVNKESILKEFELYDLEKPLFGMVSRIATQKGFDILIDALKDFLKEDVSFIILGTGDKQLEASLKSLSEKYPKKFRLLLGFDEQIAHKIYAGSDFFLMPSAYEPCGLGQLIALKYGTLPVVHAVGGLKDTIDNYNEFTKCGNGFSFEDYSREDLINMLLKAKTIFRQKDVFTSIKKKAMLCDFSWNSSTSKYEEIYREMLK